MRKLWEIMEKEKRSHLIMTPKSKERILFFYKPRSSALFIKIFLVTLLVIPNPFSIVQVIV